MLTLNVSEKEFFDEVRETFVTVPPTTLQFEHSLVSLSKWESRFKKPFLSTEKKTTEEVHGYIEAMLLTPDVPSQVLQFLSNEELNTINEYIQDTQTATWFRKNPNERPSKEIVTAELIYYWMAAFNIDFECQHWHLNRLMTLIKICGEKNSPAKKRSAADVAAERRALNEKRRAEHRTTG